MCPVTVLTRLSNCTVSHPSRATGHCSKQLRSQPQAYDNTFWIVHRHPDNQITHTLTIRYLNLQSQILAEISRTCWVSHKLRCEVLKVVIMILLITLVQPLSASRYVTTERNLPPPSSWWWRRQMPWNVAAYLPDCTVPQLRISLVSRSVWCAQDKQQQLAHLYPQ